MEPSKTNQTRWEQHHNTFIPSLHLVPFCQPCTPQTLHTPATPTSQQTTLLPTTSQLPHDTTSNTLTYHKVLGMDQPTTAHTTAFHLQDSPYLPCPATTKAHRTHVTHPNMPHRPSTHLAPTVPTYYTSWPCLPHRIATKLQPPTTQPTLHTQQHALHTSTTHPPPSLPCPRQPSCARK